MKQDSLKARIAVTPTKVQLINLLRANYIVDHRSIPERDVTVHVSLLLRVPQRVFYVFKITVADARGIRLLIFRQEFSSFSSF